MVFLNLFFGTLFFFLSGFLLVFLFYKKISLSECIVYSVIFSTFLLTFTCFLLIQFNFFNFFNIILFLSLIQIMSLICIIIKKKTFSIYYDSTFNFHFFFSIVGVFWRWFFRFPIFKWGDGITSHLDKVIIENIFLNGFNFSIPDVGFYTGMLLDHSTLIFGDIANYFYSLIGFNRFFVTFLSVFLLSFFIYNLIYIYTNKKNLALLGSFIIASLGPIEIWFNTFSFFGWRLSYIGLISLFILYLNKQKSFFYLTLLIIFSLALSYYTSLIILILTCLGFLLSILISFILEYKCKNIKIIFKHLIQDKKFQEFLFILFFLILFFFIFAGDSLIKHASNTTNSLLFLQGPKSLNYANSNSSLISRPIYPYQNKFKFLKISPLNWQNLLFILIFFMFFINIIIKTKKKNYFWEENKNLFFILIPMFFVFLALFLVNYEQRSFSYFLFFIFLILNIPKKYFYLISFFLISFFLLTGYFENIERSDFFRFNQEESSGVEWVITHLDGKILSDEKFISLLIENNYYNVTGFADNSFFVKVFFYEENISNIKNSFSFLNIDYFIITRRMKEDYLLMLSFPQEPMNNSFIYDSFFEKIYFNDEIEVYSITRLSSDNL